MAVGYVLFILLPIVSVVAYSIGYMFLARPGQWSHCYMYIVPLLCSALGSMIVATLFLLFSLTYPRKFVIASFIASPLTMTWVGCQLAYYHMAPFNVPIIVGVAVSTFHVAIKMPSASLIIAASVRKVPCSTYVFAGILPVIICAWCYSIAWIFMAAAVAYMTHQGDGHNPTVSVAGLEAAKYCLLFALGCTMCVARNLIRVYIGLLAYTRIRNGTQDDAPISKDDASQAFFSVFRNDRVLWGLSLAAVINAVTTALRFLGRIIEGRLGDSFSWAMEWYNKGVEMVERLGTRWGLVWMLEHNVGFRRASIEVREQFKAVAMTEVIKDEVTGVIIIVISTVGGAVSTGITAAVGLLTGKSYSEEIFMHAYIIGFFIHLVLLAWPQATVMALLVASAELGVEHANVSPYVRRRMLQLRKSALHSLCEATHAPQGSEVAQTMRVWEDELTEQINSIAIPGVLEELEQVHNNGGQVIANAGGV